MGELIDLDQVRARRLPVPVPMCIPAHRPRPEETIRQAADTHMVDKVLAFVESKMEMTLHRPLEPRDRVTIMRMLALAHPEPEG
jgi:hypothetical protein